MKLYNNNNNKMILENIHTSKIILTVPSAASGTFVILYKNGTDRNKIPLCKACYYINKYVNEIDPEMKI
jgi:hypothetical protein